jgi:hypothetical protein
MPERILYCDSCGKALPGLAFAHQMAYIVEERPFCAGCRPRVAPPRPSAARSHPHVPPSTSPATRIIPAMKAMGTPATFLVLGGLAVAVAVFALVFSAVGAARNVGAASPHEPAPAPAPAPGPTAPTSEETQRRIEDLERRAGTSSDPDQVLRWCEEARPHLQDTAFEARRRGVEVRAREEKARRATDLDPLLAELRKALAERPIDTRRPDIEALLAAARQVAGPRGAEVDPLRAEYARKVEEAARRVGLLGRWTFDEPAGPAAADVSGHGHEAHLTAGAARLPSPGGAALRVSGSADGASLAPGAQELDAAAEGSYTLSAWYKPELLPADADHGILGRFPAGTGLAYGRDGRFVMRHFLEGALQAHAATPDPLPPRHWYHLVGVVDLQGGSTRLYVNGQSHRVSFWAPGTRGHAPEGTCWKIGAGAHGTLDDVRIYRRALTAEDVRSLFAERGSP